MCRDIKKPRGPGETTGTIIRKDNRENIYIITRRQPFDKGGVHCLRAVSGQGEKRALSCSIGRLLRMIGYHWKPVACSP